MKEKFNKYLILFLVFTLILFISESQAQTVQRQSVASGGGLIYSNGILIQQTVGQAYSTIPYYGNTMSCRPGFQQSVIFKLEIVNTTFLVLNLNVYPNPATYSVTIESSEVIPEALIQIVDINGKLILNEKLSDLETHSINCESWANGTYIISLYDIQKNRHSINKLIINK